MGARFLLALAGAGICAGQASSTVSLSNGVQLKISADVGHPIPPAEVNIQMTRASGDSFYRIFRDQNGLAIFAYELAVNVASGGDALGLVAKPAEAGFAARFPNADAGKPVPTLSGDRPFGPLHTGETARIGLFELEGQGIRVIDSVEVVLDSEEHPGRLHLAGLRLKINGEPVPWRSRASAVAGQYAMIYIPDRGAFILSSDPAVGRGFVKAGAIEGSKLQFTVNNDSYEAEASAAILRGEAASGELWVYFDPSYQPSGNWTRPREGQKTGAAKDEIFVAASDSLSWWLP